MADPYERVKAGRLTFKGGSLATRSKAIDKKKKKKKSTNEENLTNEDNAVITSTSDDAGGGGGEFYTIDAAKRMKYEDLFPVEAKKFGYDPNNTKPSTKSAEEALDDRVQKKADRYCK